MLGVGSEGEELEIVELPRGWFGTIELTRGSGGEWLKTGMEGLRAGFEPERTGTEGIGWEEAEPEKTCLLVECLMEGPRGVEEGQDFWL